MDIEYIQIWENGEDAEPHDYRTVSTIQPSHTKEGRITTHCILCGGTSTESIPESHDEQITQGYPATCTEPGLTDEIVCTTCGKTVQKQEVIPALGHKEVTIPATVTCTEAGLTAGKKCAACAVTLVEQKESEALGHDWDDGTATIESTCTTTGEKLYTCKNDPTHTYTEELPAAHMPTTISGYAPTCTEIGLTDGTKCAVCNTLLERQKRIPATGHSEVVDNAVEPTCTETGLTEGKHCSVCNAVIVEQQVIEGILVRLG